MMMVALSVGEVKERADRPGFMLAGGSDRVDAESGDGGALAVSVAFPVDDEFVGG